MILKILVDNNKAGDSCFFTEHGLSLYIEFNSKHYLVDVGQTDMFVKNAVSADVNLEDIDYLLISHGHYDHLGGLDKFIRLNKKATIIVSDQLFRQNYYSIWQKKVRKIGYNFHLDSETLSRLRLVSDPFQPEPGVYVVGNFKKDYPSPKANRKMFVETEKDKFSKDNFKHEIVICFKLCDGLTVVSGCSHNGVLNILKTVSLMFPGDRIRNFVGGFHLPDNDSFDSFETENELVGIALELQRQFPETCFYTGHCTGNHVFDQFKNILDKNIHRYYSGFGLEIH